MGRMVRVLKAVVAIGASFSAVDCLSFLCTKAQTETFYDERFRKTFP